MLVDSRVVTDQDRQTLAWLRSIGRNPLIVATKVDKFRERRGRVRVLGRRIWTWTDRRGDVDSVFVSDREMDGTRCGEPSARPAET